MGRFRVRVNGRVRVMGRFRVRVNGRVRIRVTVTITFAVPQV